MARQTTASIAFSYGLGLPGPLQPLALHSSLNEVFTPALTILPLHPFVTLFYRVLSDLQASILPDSWTVKESHYSPPEKEKNTGKSSLIHQTD